jgi:putative membrane protein insertion efficiency factor
VPDDDGWRPPDDRGPDDTAELHLDLEADEPAGDPGDHGSAYWRKAARKARRDAGENEKTDSDLGPLREIRRRDSQPDGDGDAPGTARRTSTFRRHPARWLGSLAALVSLGAVAVGIVWTWWHSTIRIGSGSAGPSASPGSTGTPAPAGSGSSGSSTVQAGCDSGCAPVDDACNKACDDTANSCLDSTCNDTTCNDSSCNGSSCGSTSCNDQSCGSTGSRSHLVELVRRVGEWVLVLGHLPAGTPLLFTARRRVSVPARVAVRAIRWYQRRVSGELGVSCRYTPSCSRYGLAAIERYGLLDGARLAADRIHRCRPAVPVGTPDPLPGH